MNFHTLSLFPSLLHSCSSVSSSPLLSHCPMAPSFSPPRKLPFTHNVTLTVSLAAGTPPQNVTMVLDTGSELSWLQRNTTSRDRPVLDPAKSSSYSPIPCTSPTCTSQTLDFSIPACSDSRHLCHAILSYADASSSKGKNSCSIATDRIAKVAPSLFD